MDNPRELFVHELGDVLCAEQMILKILPELSREAWDAKLTATLETHLAETEKHVETVKAAFKAVGEKPKAGKCPAIKAVKKDHDRFSKQKPNRPMLDTFVTSILTRTEHYEIAAYTSLVTMADGLGETEASTLLQRNLKQEVAALERATRIATRFARKTPTNAKRREAPALA
jgi:ferritin-like metal-binding protein YciE